VRRLRRWCRNFALLPTSFNLISIRNIQLESDRPKFATALSDVFRGTHHDGTRVAVKVLRVYTNGDSLDAVQKVGA
jgi:hypothetical protein